MSHDPTDAQRLTIFCTESDHFQGKPLFEWLLQKAVQLELAGATVTRALAGFGRHHRIHHQHLISLADALPMTVQIVDAHDRIDAFLQSTAPPSSATPTSAKMSSGINPTPDRFNATRHHHQNPRLGRAATVPLSTACQCGASAPMLHGSSD
ncbi:MAG: hypothetical protein CMJ49_07750 [Planctomycetaceae bacterium]|nr:hypothetical protein [Planctomycetaceae bacterium]